MIDQCNKLLKSLGQEIVFTIDYNFENGYWWLFANSQPVIYFEDAVYVWSRALTITVLIANKDWAELSRWFNRMEMVNKGE